MLAFGFVGGRRCGKSRGLSRQWRNLGAGRAQVDDDIDPSVGLEILKKIGDPAIRFIGENLLPVQFPILACTLAVKLLKGDQPEQQVNKACSRTGRLTPPRCAWVR